MSKVRAGRVGEQIKKEISKIINTELKDPRIGFVTITGVDLTGDLSQATVHISVYGSEKEIKDTLETIEKAKGFLRSEIGKRIRFRHIPELFFKFDSSIEYGYKIEKLLKEIKETDQL
ncbi:MAG: 30S ribosome-binding factor RbfA [Vulcanibacillus sp.]